MNRITVQSPAIAAPRFRYSPCVRIGGTVQLSGMIALDAASGELVSGGPGAETAAILRSLQRALPDYGVSLDELLIARIYTTRLDLFGEINAAWEAVFTAGTIPPARTSIGVSALPLGASVEIEFTFVQAERA
ncbi:enamine deaminase RidA [Massilia sp. Root418]|uniref:RidA family protein n=1 Tax=Massilia sp. Root418 TaxID=1736532 RepID=UPI0006FA133C|nr:RidA family protein [Massilia sp. Root418]KQX01786.1 enamine deaminase RidA [Massilia sp. Root418]